MSMTDEDWYDDLVKKYGTPSHATRPTDGDLQKWQGILPDLLLRYWREQGWGGLAKGQYWVCNPDLLRPVIEELFTGDPDIAPDDMIPIGYNALGRIDVYFGKGRTMTVDLPFGTVRWRDESINSYTKEPSSEFDVIYGRIASGAHRIDRRDEYGEKLFPKALKRLGELSTGTIYGFVPAYLMGGALKVENLQTLPIVEHLVFLASVQMPTLYDYDKPEDGEDGFGALKPRRLVGPQE